MTLGAVGVTVAISAALLGGPVALGCVDDPRGWLNCLRGAVSERFNLPVVPKATAGLPESVIVAPMGEMPPADRRAQLDQDAPVPAATADVPLPALPANVPAEPGVEQAPSSLTPSPSVAVFAPKPALPNDTPALNERAPVPAATPSAPAVLPAAMAPETGVKQVSAPIVPAPSAAAFAPQPTPSGETLPLERATPVAVATAGEPPPLPAAMASETRLEQASAPIVPGLEVRSTPIESQLPRCHPGIGGDSGARALGVEPGTMESHLRGNDTVGGEALCFDQVELGSSADVVAPTPAPTDDAPPAAATVPEAMAAAPARDMPLLGRDIVFAPTPAPDAAPPSPVAVRLAALNWSEVLATPELAPMPSASSVERMAGLPLPRLRVLALQPPVLTASLAPTLPLVGSGRPMLPLAAIVPAFSAAPAASSVAALSAPLSTPPLPAEGPRLGVSTPLPVALLPAGPSLVAAHVPPMTIAPELGAPISLGIEIEPTTEPAPTSVAKVAPLPTAALPPPPAAAPLPPLRHSVPTRQSRSVTVLPLPGRGTITLLPPAGDHSSGVQRLP